MYHFSILLKDKEEIMKRFIALVLLVVFPLCLTGCMYEETVPEEKNLEVLSTLQGSTLEKTHNIEGFEFITIYDTGNYDLSRWRITDSKVINMSAEVSNVPEGATVLIEPVHIDMSLKSTSLSLMVFHKTTWMIPITGHLKMAFL